MRGGRCVTTIAFAASLAADAADAAPSFVTFRPSASLSAFSRTYAPHDREATDPDAWGYLTRSVKGAIQSLEQRHGFEATFGYSKVLRGFAADLTQGQIEALRFEPTIESITITVDVASVTAVDQEIPWGVRRIAPERTSTDSRNTTDTAPGVTVYVLDSGVDDQGGDFNVARHVNFAGGPKTDCHAHGTHVAGIIGARDNEIGVAGVAPGVTLVDVRVTDCAGNGTSASLIKGLDWIAASAVLPAVVSLSLGGGQSPALDAAVRAATDLGIFFAIAAGNTAADACLSSPALTGVTMGVVTVGAVDEDEMEAPFSDFGGCVDLWAPGVGIASTSRGVNAPPVTMSGTSMAAPHVAGAAALYLSANPRATPAEVESALIGSSAIPGTASKDGRTILSLRIAPFL